MSKVFRAYLSQGRELQLKIASIFKVGSYDAAKATILLLPSNASAVGMKSASVADPMLAPSRLPELDNVVEVQATESGIDYDPVPF
jgi:hypothetical protein